MTIILYDLMLTSDDSGPWGGCSALFDTHWFHLEWDGNSSTKSISVKKLIPVVVFGDPSGKENM